MRQAKLFGGVYSAGGSVTAKVTKGHVNGLLIVADRASEETTITVKREGTNVTHVLAANVRLSELARISDLERGYGLGSGDHVAALMDTLVTGEVIEDSDVEEIEAAHGVLGLEMLYIDLGSIYLGQGSDLDVTINFGSDFSGALRCYTVSGDKEPDRMRSYVVSQDFETVHSGVEAIFLSSPGGLVAIEDGEIVARDLTVQIEDGDGAYLSDIVGVLGASSVFGTVEGAVDQRLLLLYQRMSPVPQNVFCRLTGNLDGLRLIVRKDVYDVSLVSENTVAQAERLASEIAELERTDPDTARALRHAGQIVRSEDLRATVAALG